MSDTKHRAVSLRQLNFLVNIFTFKSLIADERTDGRTKGQAENIVPLHASMACSGGGINTNEQD